MLTQINWLQSLCLKCFPHLSIFPATSSSLFTFSFPEFSNILLFLPPSCSLFSLVCLVHSPTLTAAETKQEEVVPSFPTPHSPPPTSYRRPQCHYFDNRLSQVFVFSESAGYPSRATEMSGGSPQTGKWMFHKQVNGQRLISEEREMATRRREQRETSLSTPCFFCPLMDSDCYMRTSW